MPIDIRKALSAVLEAATQQPQAPPQPEPRKPRLTTGKALLVGAGVVTAGKLIAGPKAREMLDSMQQRIEDSARSSEDVEPEDRLEDGEDDEAYEDDDEPEGEADEDFDEEDYDDEEPEDEADEDFEDEEPEDEADEDFDEEDDEPEAEDDEDPRHGSESRRRRQRPRARARGRH